VTDVHAIAHDMVAVEDQFLYDMSVAPAA